MSLWERKRILIWGKTRPELSKSHKETVCTGGVFEDTKQFVRLYPIPLRYLDHDQVFKKYQWIEADIRKAMRDARPESYNIRCDSITPGDTIPTSDGDWSQRAAWIIQPSHVFTTVSDLLTARERAGTTLGMVKPSQVLRVFAEPYPSDEKQGFWSKYHTLQQQQELPFEEENPVKPISPPDYRFKIKFRSGNTEHEFSVLDWEVDALYFGCRKRGDACETARDKVIAKLRDDVCGENKDTYFFLGNVSQHPHRFTIVGLWYPKKPKSVAPTLFDGV